MRDLHDNTHKTPSSGVGRGRLGVFGPLVFVLIQNFGNPPGTRRWVAEGDDPADLDDLAHRPLQEPGFWSDWRRHSAGDAKSRIRERRESVGQIERVTF